MAKSVEVSVVLGPIAESLALVGKARVAEDKAAKKVRGFTAQIAKSLYDTFGPAGADFLFKSPEDGTKFATVDGGEVDGPELFAGLKAAFVSGFSQSDLALFIMDKPAADAAKLSESQRKRWTTVRRMPNAYVSGNLKGAYAKIVREEQLNYLHELAENGDEDASEMLSEMTATATLWTTVQSRLADCIKKMQKADDSGCPHHLIAIKYMQAAIDGRLEK